MKTHDLAFASPHDMREIMEFIRAEWKPDHILALNEDFFKYEFIADGKVNFVLARNSMTGKIDGLEGFIPYGPESESNDIFLALWKVVKQSGNNFLGVEILNYLIENLKFRTLSCCGINQKTIPIYKFLGHRTGELEHYYMLNSEKESFEIAVKNSSPPSHISDSEFEVVPIHESEFSKFQSTTLKWGERKPYKSAEYFRRRYFQHPIYKYEVYGISSSSSLASLIVTRRVKHKGAQCLRIVDFIGRDEDLRGIGYFLRAKIKEHDYEYIDLYQIGIPQEILKETGFKLKDKEDNNIIPNYFEPFVQANTPLYYFTTTREKIYMFKGDGDQDRPSFSA